MRMKQRILTASLVLLKMKWVSAGTEYHTRGNTFFRLQSSLSLSTCLARLRTAFVSHTRYNKQYTARVE